jgi:hypothetical protein
MKIAFQRKLYLCDSIDNELCMIVRCGNLRFFDDPVNDRAWKFRKRGGAFLAILRTEWRLSWPHLSQKAF